MCVTSCRTEFNSNKFVTIIPKSLHCLQLSTNTKKIHIPQDFYGCNQSLKNMTDAVLQCTNACKYKTETDTLLRRDIYQKFNIK